MAVFNYSRGSDRERCDKRHFSRMNKERILLFLHCCVKLFSFPSYRVYLKGKKRLFRIFKWTCPHFRGDQQVRINWLLTITQFIYFYIHFTLSITKFNYCKMGQLYKSNLKKKKKERDDNDQHLVIVDDVRCCFSLFVRLESY